MNSNGQTAAPRTDLRVPSHGHGRLAPAWQKGQAPNPGGRGGQYHDAIRILREWATIRGAERMLELAESDDERVAAMMTQAIWDRAFGKPRERPPEADGNSRTAIDLTKLRPEELQLLRTLFERGVVRTIEGGGTEK